AVRNSKDRGMLSPWALLRGTVPVEATGILRTENGVAAFTLEGATVRGVPVPKAVLQELVSYYSQGPNAKDGVNFEAPFRLPAHIGECHAVMGGATAGQERDDDRRRVPADATAVPEGSRPAQGG